MSKAEAYPWLSEPQRIGWMREQLEHYLPRLAQEGNVFGDVLSVATHALPSEQREGTVLDARYAGLYPGKVVNFGQTNLTGLGLSLRLLRDRDGAYPYAVLGGLEHLDHQPELYISCSWDFPTGSLKSTRLRVTMVDVSALSFSQDARFGVGRYGDAEHQMYPLQAGRTTEIPHSYGRQDSSSGIWRGWQSVYLSNDKETLTLGYASGHPFEVQLPLRIERTDG